MDKKFKYNIGQIVLYKNKQYTVLSRSYVETEYYTMTRYNLGRFDIYNRKDYEPNVWEDDISTID